MNIKILQCEKGAEQAEGMTVIIDVFRAFTLEAYLYAAGMEKIIAAASVEDALSLKKSDESYILFGERNGLKCIGFDYGNSPSAAAGTDFTGRTAVHTTSNGTRGIMKASGASQIITGAFVNARAAAEYVRRCCPEKVSLVCMGWKERPSQEDTLCAEYIKALLENKDMSDIDRKLENLKYTSGAKFFDPLQQDAYPQADFPYCIQRDIFDFVIRCEKKGQYIINKKI